MRLLGSVFKGCKNVYSITKGVGMKSVGLHGKLAVIISRTKNQFAENFGHDKISWIKKIDEVATEADPKFSHFSLTFFCPIRYIAFLIKTVKNKLLFFSSKIQNLNVHELFENRKHNNMVYIHSKQGEMVMCINYK